MTANQIAFYKAQEDARHNKVVEEIESPKADLTRAQTSKAQAEAQKTSTVDTHLAEVQASRLGTQIWTDVTGGFKNLANAGESVMKTVTPLLNLLGG